MLTTEQYFRHESEEETFGLWPVLRRFRELHSEFQKKKLLIVSVFLTDKKYLHPHSLICDNDERRRGRGGPIPLLLQKQTRQCLLEPYSHPAKKHFAF